MKELLGGLKQRTAVFLLLFGLLAVFGLAYEYAFFSALGLDVLEHLDAAHLAWSGLREIVILLAIVTSYALIRKFFTKAIERDDFAAVAEELKSRSFGHDIKIARFAFVVAFVYFLLAQNEMKFLDTPRFWAAYIWLFILILQSFIVAIILSPQHSRMVVAFAAFLSISFCLAGNGASSAHLVLHQARLNAPGTTSLLLRNDSVVRISLVEGKPSVQPKKFPIELSHLTPSRLFGLLVGK